MEGSRLEFKLDPWQEKVLNIKGNIAIRAGRQVGKSTVISMKAARFAVEYPNTTTLIIAASQRQSSLLFEKVRGEIELMIEEGQIEYEDEPTMTRLKLSNGSRIYSLPAGRTGYFIRGFTIDMLIADEAAYINEEVWKSVIPMVAVSRKLRGLGHIILLSTPWGKGGYFYSAFTDKDFSTFHVSSEICSRIPPEFLAKERARLTKAEYAQEYLGEFVEEWNQFFATELIRKCMTIIEWDFKKNYSKKFRYYLGVDIARYGGDENAFIVAEMDATNNIKIVKALTTTRISLTDTIGRIKMLHEMFGFSRIFVDDAGVGGGVLDVLLEDKETKRVTIGLNNASRSVDRERHRRSILKEDLYSNALVLMESHKILMINEASLAKSLKSITFEYTSDKFLKITGSYSHLTEAMVRACWCIREKGLRVFIA